MTRAMRHFAAAVVLTAVALALACSRAPVVFSDQNARAHLGMLAGTIGSRPVGTPANARAREYIVDQLRIFGFDVRVQEADARRAETGVTARVANVIAVKQGARPEAIGLLAHYDSVPEAPGAADDAFGVAVALEAGRVLAARPQLPWSLMLLLTDGEEANLMGAAALMTDREVTSRLHAYLNLEAIGSSGPAVLFEIGPGNSWLVRPWARAPYPRGGSFGIEVYRRLPNDTDFTILRRHEIPGLNFAVIGDSYAYHTARDTPERVSTSTLRTVGENIVAIVSALDGVDITERTTWLPTYFDVGGRAGVVYGPAAGWIAAAVALLAGVIGTVRTAAAAIRMGGVGRWLLTMMWSIVGAALVVASMVGATWLLRLSRETYHPWYARPGRLFLLLLVVGVTVGWAAVRAGQWLPRRAHGLRHPEVVWSVTLPVWTVLAFVVLWYAPAAAYLWVLPLAAAGLFFAVVPVGNPAAVRLASAIVLGISATLWFPNTPDLLQFAVAVFGRLPVVTPVFVYAAIMAAAGLMVVPPFVAMVATLRPLLRPVLMTAVLLLAVAIAGGLAYSAPAYTSEQPLRRTVRAVQDAGSDAAIWEVGSTEPGIDLAEGAPGGWTPVGDATPVSIPRGRLRHPFVFRTTGPGLGPAPAAISEAAINPLADGLELSLAVVPREPGLTFAFVMPEGIAPARANLPAVTGQGRWTATYVAAPPDGVRLRATFPKSDEGRLRGVRVAVVSPRFPGGEGWQSLPGWLPQERTVWSASATWIVDPFAAPPIAPVPALR